MEHEFDQAYWDDVWQGVRAEATARGELPPNPYLVEEIRDLAPATALEAGCGDGVEARWLARAGWAVTAADIAEEPLARAAARAETECLGDRVTWVKADLSTWEPGQTFDLVTTHYAHPSMPQLDFYVRLATWVAPGGSLLIVGHLHTGDDSSQGHGHAQGESGGHGHGHQHGHGHGGGHGHGHGHGGVQGVEAHDADTLAGQQPPPEASVTAASITERFDANVWHVVTADECSRPVPRPDGSRTTLHDVVVRVVRR